MTVRVISVDDQELVRAGFVALLQSDPDIEVAGKPVMERRPSNWRAEPDPTLC
jgi:DNA-binding NarL/FixJ family response regulator